VLASFVHFDAQDVPGPAGLVANPAGSAVDALEGHIDAATGAARDCGDDFDSCQSGFTFFRQDSQSRAFADQSDPSNTVEVVYNGTRPGTETTPTGSTYGTFVPGQGGQGLVYYTSIVNGVPQGNGAPVSDVPKGHQFFPDVTAAGGKIRVIWWDSREDPSYSTALPIGDTAARTSSGAFLKVYGTSAPVGPSPHFSAAVPVSQAGTNGNYEQFDDRRIPFAGDYLWLTASPAGNAYVVWTDWRNTVPGTDPRPFETGEPRGAEGFDVLQCRTAADNFASDSCQAAGGKDQNIYGSALVP
jgi:hypothetical protein